MVSRGFPISQPKPPLRRPMLPLWRAIPSSSQTPVVVVVESEEASVVDALARMVDGILAIRCIHFVDGISSAITARYINTETDQQIGGQFSGGPSTEVHLTGTAVEFGTTVRVEYKTDTSASGYSDIASWRTLSTIIMLDDEEEIVLYVPKIALP